MYPPEKQRHNSSNVVIKNSYTYDHAGRKKETRQQINSNPEVVLSFNEYNELGQLIDKKLHRKVSQNRFMQSVDYRYYIRGWLRSINEPNLAVNSTNIDSTAHSDGDKFGMALTYETGTIPQYNGNISSVTWRNAMATPTMTTAPPQMKYDFRYDQMNRLTQSVSSTAGSKNGLYNEFVSYDNMGNIQRLGRWTPNSSGTRVRIDSLVYSYSGNKIVRVDDTTDVAVRDQGFSDNGSRATSEIAYDPNGRVNKDLNKKITSISYFNVLNLPNTVTFSNGDKVAFEYDRTGKKIRKDYTTGGALTRTDYIDGIQYVTVPGGARQIEFVQTEEGRARKSGTDYIYEYDLKDHLGNTRVTVRPLPGDDTQSTAEIVHMSNYYPFGMTMPDAQGRISITGNNKYLYNGKELQDEGGLGWYDYGARFYDPVIGRWMAIDPMAEKHTGITPYNYVLNNPMLYADEFGMDTTKVIQLKEVVVTAEKADAAVNVLTPGVPFNWNNIDYKEAQRAAGVGTRETLKFTGEQIAWSLFPWGRLGKWGKAGFSLLVRGGEAVLPEVAILGTQKMLKIMNSTHAWSKVAAGGEAEIKSIMSTALSEGVEMSYGNAAMGSGSKILSYNGEIVQVVTNQVGGKTVVSNAWVITDPAYKWQALKLLNK